MLLILVFKMNIKLKCSYNIKLLKVFIGSIILFFFTSLSFSQDKASVRFIDETSGQPIEGVMIFIDGDFISSSDESGLCELNGNISEIYCRYLGFVDTLINMSSVTSGEIRLKSDFNLIDEVEVGAKYNEKKHLLKLLEKSQKISFDIDTIVYYKFVEINSITELNQKEIFAGVLRVENKGYSKSSNIILLSSISNYYNTIEEGIYEKMQSSRVFEKFIIDILYPHSIKRLNKNQNIEKVSRVSRDSIYFYMKHKDQDISSDINYYGFINDKIKIRESANVINRDGQTIRIYDKATYENSGLIFPDSIVSSRGYYLDNKMFVVNSVSLESIDKPFFANELDQLFYNSSCKTMVDRAKLKFPELIIPSEKMED